MKLWVRLFLLGMFTIAGNGLHAAESLENAAAETTTAHEGESLFWDADGNGRMSAAERQAVWLKSREKRKSPFITNPNEKEPLTPSRK